jgi:CDP-glucose 4,6-dehydratase
MTAIFPELKDRRVLLTGHTGFKGSWMAQWLARLGAKVTGYALPAPTNPSNYEASKIRELLAGEYLKDIRDLGSLQKAFDETQPEVVLHLAAQALVHESYLTPHETFDVNVMGTSAVLDIVRKSKRPAVVVICTSDKCYDNKEQIWGYRESDALGGYDPYSASKGAAEIVTASYRRAFFHPSKLAEHGVKIASARAGNVIGGGDWAKDRIVTDVIAALSAGKPIPVRSPRAIRPWQHVLEPLSGYLTLANRMLASNDPAWCCAWNFGPVSGSEMLVRALAEAFVKHWGSGSWEDRSDPNAPHEAGILRLSIDKAISHLAWRPQWNFDETVRRTARWYRQFKPGISMRDQGNEDIQAYEQAMQNGKS